MMMSKTLSPVQAVLQACPCGNAHPVPGWRGRGSVIIHFVHCCDCGQWAEGPTEDQVTAVWNVKARRARGAA